MKIEDLFEMSPKEIDSLDWFALNDPEENRKEYVKRLRGKFQYKKLILKFSETAAIYQHGNEFFCMDAKLQRITYYMSYEVAKHRKIGNYVWQSLVWTSAVVHISYLKEIPQKIFWEQLFPKFGTILTDSEQTWQGRRFWEYRIAEALEKKLNVYYFDFAKNQLEKLNDFDELRIFQQKYNIWGEQDANALRRMLITSKKLET